MSSLQRFQKELTKIAKLPVGWDSYDAPPPGQNSIESTCRFLDSLAKMPGIGVTPSRVAPVVDGGIAVSFLRDNVRASIEFSNTGDVVGVIARQGCEIVVWDIEDNEGMMAAVRRIESALVETDT